MIYLFFIKAEISDEKRFLLVVSVFWCEYFKSVYKQLHADHETGRAVRAGAVMFGA